MRKRTLTKQHRRALSRAMKGKNRQPRTIAHRAAIAASMLVGRDDPRWQRVFRDKLRSLQIASELSA